MPATYGLIAYINNEDEYKYFKVLSQFMASPPKKKTKTDKIERYIEKEILGVLIRDFIYVLIAMIAIHILGIVANYLNAGVDGYIPTILKLSDGFYLAVYFLSVIKSLLQLILRGIKDVIKEYYEVMDVKDERKKR